MAQQTLNTPRETTHQRIAAALEAIEQNMSDEHEAVNIDYDNTTSGLSANKVQSAIDELALAGFVTNTVNNLVNYYLKSETYNKAEVDSLINAVKNSRFEAVSTLPTTNIKTNVIYLVPKSPTQTNNAKDEYINLDGTSSGWEKIGDTEVDLSGYVTTTALNTALSNYTTTANLTNLLNNKVDKVNGKGLSTNDYTTADKNKLTGIEAEANKTVVDSAMSDSSTNPLQNKVITKELEGAKTATGNPITVTDAAPVNAVNLSMDLEPIQDLHGYDHPWVGGAGKNKLQVTAQTTTSYGVTFDVKSDGTIDLSGTPEGIAQLTVTDADHTIIDTSESYILNGLEETSNVTWNTSALYDANGNILKTYPISGRDAVTFDDFSNYPTAKFFSVFIKRYKNDTPCTGTAKIMLRESTETDSTFAPYTNICPISGRSEVAINRGGKNLFDESAVTNGKVIDYNSGNIFINADWYTSDYIPVISGDKYTFSGVCLISSGEQWWYDKDKQPLLVANDNATKTVPNEAYYFRFSRKISDGYVGQIVKTTTYTIQLGDTVYGGTLDVTRGKMVVDKGYVEFDGSSDESFYLQSINSYGIANFSIDDANFNPSRTRGYCITNEFKRQNTTIANTTDMGFFNSPTLYIRILSSYASTVSEFRTWLSSNPLQIAYELATPITIQLTPQQIKMLENTNTIYTDYEGDTITIEYQPNNAIGEAVRVVEESYDAIIQNLLERIEALENNE